MAEKTDLAITGHPSESSSKSEKASSVTKAPDENTLSGSETDIAVVYPDAEITEVPEQEWVTGLPLFMILGSITLVIFLMLLDMTIIAVVCLHSRFLFSRPPNYLQDTLQAVPQITQEFHSLGDVGWYGSAYNLARYVTIMDLSNNLPAITITINTPIKNPAQPSSL